MTLSLNNFGLFGSPSCFLEPEQVKVSLVQLSEWFATWGALCFVAKEVGSKANPK